MKHKTPTPRLPPTVKKVELLRQSSVTYCQQGIMHQGSVNEECVNTKKETSTWNLYKSHLTSPTILLVLLSHFLINIGACSYYAFCPDRATQFGRLTMVGMIENILPCFTVSKSPVT